MLELYKPRIEDLWFRQALLSDPETMAYNRAWGGTIAFPETAWAKWHAHWLGAPAGERFYRYLRDGDAFVGEIAWHRDAAQGLCLADVIVAAQYRGRGYGRAGLRLLCAAAREAGVAWLYDDIAIDNPAIGLFLSEGFIEEYRTDEIIMLKKAL